MVSIDVNKDIICIVLIGQCMSQSISKRQNQDFPTVVDSYSTNLQDTVQEAEFSLRFFLVHRVWEGPLPANGHGALMYKIW